MHCGHEIFFAPINVLDLSEFAPLAEAKKVYVGQELDELLEGTDEAVFRVSDEIYEHIENRIIKRTDCEEWHSTIHNEWIIRLRTRRGE